VTPGEPAVAVETPATSNSPELLVRVEHAAKAFGATRALRDCSFELRAGEVHALVGENGSGKSTLVKILSGVHVPDSGRVEVAGSEVQLRSPKAAQDRGIATVFQEVLVARDCSVLDNVWLGADATWRARIPGREKRRLAKAALEELLGRPVDLGAIVDELSLSDRQACCIVRALLRRPRILILDEATSSLDSESEALIQDGLRSLRAGRTTFVIAHRLSTIRSADQILVLEGGEIVEHGTHDELLAAEGRYRQLYDKQYRFERNQFINPGEDFTPEPEKPLAVGQDASGPLLPTNL